MPTCPSCPSKVEPNATRCAACGASFLKPDLGLLESRLTPAQEAAAKVPGFVSVVLGLLGIGGAAWGLIAIASVFAKGWPGVFSAALIIGMAGVFAFGAYAGVLALRRTPGWLRKNTVFWALQVPVFSSPLLSYSLASGAFFTVWVQLYPPIRVGTNFFFGSSFTINLLHKVPVVVGANLLALAVVLYLTRVQARSAS
jgi:hypothetical protein